MAIRIRIIDGKFTALCAAETQHEDGDTYLDDNMHHALSAKFYNDFVSEGLINGERPMTERKLIEERRKKYVVAKEEDDIKCNFTSCAHGMGLAAGTGRCTPYGVWDNPDCPYFISHKDYEREGLQDRIQDRLSKMAKLTHRGDDSNIYNPVYVVRLENNLMDITSELTDLQV